MSEVLETTWNIICSVLLHDERIWIDQKSIKDKDNLNYTKLLDLLENLDKTIIFALSSNAVLKEKFFIKINDIVVFNHKDFKFFIEQNKINNSYTNYVNRIGLTDGKRFIKDTNDVVLNFPYKDCILEGGQSKDDGEDEYYEYAETVNNKDITKGYLPEQYNLKATKRKEIFFNEVLAKDEIDRLKEPKAFVNWKRYSKDGVHAVETLQRDHNNVIKDNLIIKGNNLLALYSLKKQFAGKIKLIYIDPPYNTGNDSFKYNDNFNHSTWLVFMKNRLEIARDLLRDDGVIFVQCDDNEQAYLKVLMDEVFGRENFVNTLIWLNKEGGGKSDSKFFIKKEEYLLCYAYNIELLNINQKILQEDKSYNYEDQHIEKRGRYKLIKLNSFSIQYSESLDYPINTPDGNLIYPHENGKKGCWRWSVQQYEWGLQNDFIVFKKNTNGVLWVYTKQYFKVNHLGENIQRSLPFLTRIEEFSSTTATKEQEKIFNQKIFKYPKPEGLIKHIIAISTHEDDIVLDYHLGSGTTASVAHKMGRRYIGIEQMDYIENIVVTRLQNIINGDPFGISKSVNWQGGGTFVYCELASWNAEAKNAILACDSLQELIAMFDDMCNKYFLNYNVQVDNFKNKIIHEENFKKLSLEQQKAMFIKMLDLNQMYINKLEMKDTRYGLNAEDIRMTELFYSKD